MMITPYHADDQVTLWQGDAAEVLAAMPDGSVDCCVTSPPYYGLRDYGEAGQYGLEASPAAYVERLRTVFAQVRRVLADDGTLWLNLGDSYSSRVATRPSSHQDGLFPDRGELKKDWRRDRDRGLTRTPSDFGLPEKNLVGLPWRVAFALQADGWILRNAVVWAKTNGMPESVQDRLSTRHELIFLLTKSRRYWFDLDAIREPLRYPEAADGSRVFGGKAGGAGKAGSSYRTAGGMPNRYDNSRGGRNPGDVWIIPTTPFAEAHFATFPVEIPRRAIAAGCRPGGTVMDPFSGSGTTGMVAGQLGRRYIGIDLSTDYLDLSLRTRLAQTTFVEGEAS